MNTYPLIRVCSWCNKILAPGTSDKPDQITHTCCDECFAKVSKEGDGFDENNKRMASSSRPAAAFLPTPTSPAGLNLTAWHCSSCGKSFATTEAYLAAYCPTNSHCE